MKKKNPQSRAHDFRTKLTPRFDSGQERGQRYAKFLCKNASLARVLKGARAMTLKKSEHDANREQALLVYQSIENALSANTIEHATQLAFNAGLRWMQIFWAKSMKSPGVDRYGEWAYIQQIANQFPKLKKIEMIRRGLEKFELHTGKKAREEIYFQKKFASILKNPPRR